MCVQAVGNDAFLSREVIHGPNATVRLWRLDIAAAESQDIPRNVGAGSQQVAEAPFPLLECFARTRVLAQHSRTMSARAGWLGLRRTSAGAVTRPPEPM